MLRGQIESHFLFSSLSGLKTLIRRENNDGAVAFVQQLARLFRLSLENARQPFVPLKNELEALAGYLAIQQALFENQFAYTIEVEGVPDREAILILPMLLQLFIENAILHGFAGQKVKGSVDIRIQYKQNILYCVIEDNGRGLQGTEMDFSQKRPLSTLINQKRLRLLSKQTKTRAGLTINDKKATTGEAGVQVELLLPYQREGG